MTTVAAVDLGATSGRVILGEVEGGMLHLDHVARFANTPVHLADGLHWDVVGLYANAMTGLGEASRRSAVVGAAVDSWAIDYALLRHGRPLGPPFHYRDDRSRAGQVAVQKQVSASDLFARNGLQDLPFTTLYQLAVDRADGVLDAADRMLLIPDLLGYWATGRAVAERTNASTTGLVAAGTAWWDDELCATLGIPRALMPEIVEPGTDLGPVLPAVAAHYGIDTAVRFGSVGSHDTASAVVGVPFADPDAAYISCGTWSLVGAELEHPDLSDAARVAGFTNEGGVDGRVRFLANVMGLWLLNESVRAWSTGGATIDLADLLEKADAVSGPVPRFDVDDPRLLAPGDMPARIDALVREQGDAPAAGRPEAVRSILESLAAAYARRVDDLERLTGRRPPVVHIVGGGAQNTLLCRLTAEATGLHVVAGPVEATAIGNLLVQARAHGLLSGDLDALRRVVESSFQTTSYSPRTTATMRG